ncbi:MAG: DoxX family protein [Cellulomonadaceae bacterium]
MSSTHVVRTGSRARSITRVALGAALAGAGISHLTFAREEFRAQVPEFVPLDKDTTVVASGVVEIALGTSLALWSRRRSGIGLLMAGFFAAVFPGNLAQWRHHRDGFGLDTDTKRAVRLAFQPVLIALALWATGPRR